MQRRPFVLALPGLASALSAQAGNVQPLDQLTVRVVFAERLEPLCWEEAGQAKGEQVEIAQQSLALLGLRMQPVFLPWARAQKWVEDGEADLMMTTPTAKRFGYAAFGKEMTTPNYWNAFVHRSQPEVIEQVRKARSLDDLRSLELVDFYGNGWSEAYMPGAGGFKVQRAGDLERVVLMLAKGRAQASVNSSVAMNWFLRKLNRQAEFEEVPLEMAHTRFHMTFQVSRRSPWLARGLVKGLDSALVRLKARGDWLRVLSKFGNPYARQVPFTSTLATEAFYTSYGTYPDFGPLPSG